MSELFEFEAQIRTEHGKAASRRMRRIEDKVPAIVYGAGKEPTSISILHKDVLRALKNEAVYSHILTLKIDGKPESVVLKAMMRHPSKPVVQHIDFLRVNAKEKLTMNVPLHFEGEELSPGVKANGVLSKLMTELEVSCLPGNLPEFIAVDISTMAVGDSVHLSEVPMPKGVELLHAVVDDEHDHAVVSIHAPQKEEVDDAEAAPAVAAEVPRPGDEVEGSSDAS